ncbi:hypothetical protein FB45DRAFT_291116 [Roridomyces roridus]|uniref:Wax synthase domain-containing protein n=1 Tax=Roridomyces roridus TaxID=1738132 RepID=A0AAD7CBT3_9AGAR|nr:hypothetical protein FB45DRAFT_291116 [Roridomyces roridus]
MKPTLYREIQVGALRAFRTIIPEPSERIPISLTTTPLLLCSFLPIVFLAFLSRRPSTYNIRILLLPSTLIACLWTGFKFMFTIPELAVYNWGLALLSEVLIAKALQYALTPEGMLKIGEREPGQPKGKEVANGSANDHAEHSEATEEVVNGSANGHAKPSETTGSRLVPAWLYDAFELIHTMRGLGWKFSHGTYIPPPTRPLERRAFLRATAVSFIQNFLLLDLLECCIKVFPGVGVPSGGSMFFQNLPLIPRYTVSTIIHMLTGSALLAGFGMVYDLIVLIAVGVFYSRPAKWPPILDNPWQATSMHDLWAKDWHQLLRSTFTVLGGYPGRWIAGDLGMLLGTFGASGLFHETSMYAMGRPGGFDHTVTLFFAIQGPILIGERLWRQVTGKRVNSRLWVYFVMFIAAQPMTNSWHKRGLGGGMVIPPFVSPLRLFMPVVMRYWGIGRP